MSVPRVSVIVPVHNTELYLRECLDSILSQTEQNIEVICVDDGSTDSSPDILEEYAQADSRIRVIREDCRGAGAARNLGLAQAQGEYLSFLDSDDRFEGEMLEEAANQLDQTDADIAVFSSWMYDSDQDINRPATWTFRSDYLPDECPFSWRDMPNRIFNSFGNYTWNKLFRHSFVKKHSILFQEISRTNDLLFVCKALMLADRIVPINKRFVHYRVTSKSSLQATNDRDPLAFYSAFCALQDFLIEASLYDQVSSSFLNHALDGVIANMESLKTLDGFNRLRGEVLKSIEPRFKFLSFPSSQFDNQDQLEQYRQLVTGDAEEYLFARSAALRKNRERLYWILDQKDQHIRGCHDEIARINEQREREVNELRNELEAIRGSKSFRLGVFLTSPARSLKRLAQKPNRV